MPYTVKCRLISRTYNIHYTIFQFTNIQAEKLLLIIPRSIFLFLIKKSTKYVFDGIFYLDL